MGSASSVKGPGSRDEDHSIPLGGGREFDRIRAIVRALGDVAEGIGDDTAVIPAGEGTLVVSTDVSVDEVHFRRAWLSFEEIGWRAAAGALSDLAAAAATPAGLVVAIVAPAGADEEPLVDLMRGIGAAAQSVGAKVIGGDLSSGGQWAIAITVMGHVLKTVSRRGAQPGDGIWVTGALGGAAIAVRDWTAGVEPDAAARAAFAHPVPRIASAQWLADHGATAMLDLSDGLGGDATHLAAASGVALEIELADLPLHSSVVAAMDRLAERPEAFAASAGEDYELLLTLSEDFDRDADFFQDSGTRLTRIGTVSHGAGVRAMLRGAPVVLHGFQHDV